MRPLPTVASAGVVSVTVASKPSCPRLAIVATPPNSPTTHIAAGARSSRLPPGRDLQAQRHIAGVAGERRDRGLHRMPRPPPPADSTAGAGSADDAAAIAAAVAGVAAR